jgi:hypothetical protein
MTTASKPIVLASPLDYDKITRVLSQFKSQRSLGIDVRLIDVVESDLAFTIPDLLAEMAIPAWDRKRADNWSEEDPETVLEALRDCFPDPRISKSGTNLLSTNSVDIKAMVRVMPFRKL